MDKYFRIEKIAATSNPQQTSWLAMHQDYSSYPVFDTIDRIPNEQKAGDLLVEKCLKFGHWSVTEHPQISFNCIGFPHETVMQLRTHRVGITFDVQCLAGDTEITFVKSSGALKKIKISELCDLWTNGEKAIRERKIRGRKGEKPGNYRRDCKKRIKKMKLRVLNEKTGVFKIGHIQNVFDQGIQPVYRLTLEDGRSLECTQNHRLLTIDGWKTMQDALSLKVSPSLDVIEHIDNCYLMSNGVVVGEGLYRDKNWLQEQLSAGLTVREMAQKAECSIEAIKKWVYIHKLSLNKSKTGTKNPWNKGLKGAYQLDKTPEQRLQRRERAKQYTRRGENSNFWKGGVTKERVAIGAWTRTIAPQVHEKFNYVCQRCTVRGGKLHAHHLLPVYSHPDKAYDFNNLVTVCKSCHETIHSQGEELSFAKNFVPIDTLPSKPKQKGIKLKAHPLKVVAVKYLGMQRTYDLEVNGDWHNFVANGLVVHNSFRYTSQSILDVASENKELEEVFYLRPEGEYTDRNGDKYVYTKALREEDAALVKFACKNYARRFALGLSEEHARGLLPMCVRQHFVMSLNARSLMHLLDVRFPKDAQLEAQQFCELLFIKFKEWMPEVAAFYEQKRLGKNKLAP